tara:strand:- start:791 stop:901 length:111 start_codon:yes stop_codon:yes gene_type:complete
MMYWCVICDCEVLDDEPPMCRKCNDYDGIVEVGEEE